jgi:hypothetical protein
MKKMFIVGVFGFSALLCSAQQTQSQIPDAPTPMANQPERPTYSPPTQAERFKSYLRQTYGIGSIVEAAAHAGIKQAKNSPSQWPQGAEGYGDRFGSAFGEIVVRETTEYVLADLFREDLRRARCDRPCSKSKFVLAFEDTFMARRGSDGHESFSVARIVGPFSGSAVAVNTWYPAGSDRLNVARDAGLQFGLKYVRNLVRESLRR